MIVEVFGQTDLLSNWAPGKSDSMVKYRGKRAVAVLESHRHDGKLSYQLPGTAQRLHIVPEYKPSGLRIRVDGQHFSMARQLACSALTAYMALAVKLFGSPCVSTLQKFVFGKGLVMSKCAYNLQIVAPTSDTLKRVN